MIVIEKMRRILSIVCFSTILFLPLAFAASEQYLTCPQEFHCTVMRTHTFCKPSPFGFSDWTASINDPLPKAANHQIFAIFRGVFIEKNGVMLCQYRYENGAVTLSPPFGRHYQPIELHKHWTHKGRNHYCAKQKRASACVFRLSR